MPKRSPPNKKGPPGLAAREGTANRHGDCTPPSPRGQVENGKRALQPPRDPYLRAVWKVSHAKDLSPAQKLAYLALWRLLKNGPKKIGAALLANLLDVTDGAAKNLFSALQSKGYLKSDGKFRPGRQARALRSLTDKLHLPTGKFRSSNRDHSRSGLRSSNRDLVRSSDHDLDLGVGHTRGCCVSDDTPTCRDGGRNDSPRSGRTVNIADLLANDPPVKSGEGAA